MLIHPGLGHAGLVYANPPEWNEIRCWRHHLKPGDLFIDVGANIGSYTIWALEMGCEVIAIEPDPWAADQLEKNLALNGYSAQVVRAALGSAPGRAWFTSRLGVLNHIVEDPHETSEAVREVPVITLDELIGKRKAAGVKIDVEGSELVVLEGAQETLGKGRLELIQLEWNRHDEDGPNLPAFLRNFGYRLYRPDEEGLLHPLEREAPGADVFAKMESVSS